MIKLLFTIFIVTITLKNIHRIIKFFVKRTPVRQFTAEILIENQKKKQIRPLKVEQKYNIVKYNFNHALKNKEIDRNRVLAIKEYLKEHTYKWEYKDKKFKNDAHMIYHLMKSRALKSRDFDIIGSLIGMNYIVK